ncbi:MarR family winged helix-turn-helix transcriptional regulator [Pseudonocardia sp. TRM90224]|uniref:MarR family winged helix-turn-helix transcriptional regulator n=1 Tax=Pseudonocardia sp. TRM90224 TaxID=2812678 RepID=UPI001E4AB21C|nr:MarR family transcriptional regulator [Pseudonocardia sp. TRM90224]
MDESGARSDYDPPGRLTRLPSWLVGQVAAAAGRLVADALAAEGLRRQHFAVISALAERGASSQASLGRRLLIDRSDMHALLGDLDERGLVARVRDEQDRRRMLVELTSEGTALLTNLDTRIDAAQDALMAPLSTEERNTLQELLTRVLDHHPRHGSSR